MRPIAILFALVLLLSGWSPTPAQAGPLDDVSERDVLSIEQVIRGQLDAFQLDDGVRAFSLASPSIQAIFQSPDRFMQMVRAGYQPVYRPRQVEFGRLIEFQGQPTQLVTLVGPDGRVVAAYYLMERQPDGFWRIDGCILREAPAV
jgi:hypothetical protein